MLAVFGPMLLIELLFVWALLQITGFGLIWWGLGDIPTIDGFGDAWYYSGVIFFTVGFGEIVPTEVIPRSGAILEAFFGVITVALVVGYLPSLYAAYSDRERTLMTLDAGGTDRITPTALVVAWAPDADAKKIDAQFERWEQWAAGILETHSTVPLLAMFRSHDQRQNWVYCAGVVVRRSPARPDHHGLDRWPCLLVPATGRGDLQGDDVRRRPERLSRRRVDRRFALADVPQSLHRTDCARVSGCARSTKRPPTPEPPAKRSTRQWST